MFLLLLVAAPLEMVVQNSHTNQVRAMAWSPDGQYFVTAARAQTKLWNREGVLLRTSPVAGVSAVFFPDSKEFAVGGAKIVSVFSLDGTRKASFPACAGH